MQKPQKTMRQYIFIRIYFYLIMKETIDAHYIFAEKNQYHEFSFSFAFFYELLLLTLIFSNDFVNILTITAGD